MAAQQTEELAVALKDTDIVTVLDSIIDPKVAPKANKTDLDKKVNKVTGKKLSTEDFTTALKTKLATLEGSHFKGVHKDLAALETAHPAGSIEAGSYGYVKDGTNAEKLAMLDGGVWVELTSGSAGTPTLTGAQIKALYEGNADTEGLTTALKTVLSFLTATKAINLDTTQDNVQVAFNRIADLGLASPTAPAKSTQSQRDIEVPKQTLSQDPNITAKDNRLITVSNSFAMEIALKQWVDINTMSVKSAPVTDIATIADTGIYYGKDVANSPIQGDIMVMASKDKDGNFGFFLMGSDQVLHTGGKPKGGTAVRWAALVQASDIGDIHSLMAGHDLAYYLGEFQKQIGALQHSAGQVATTVKDADWTGTISVNGKSGAFIMGDIKNIVLNPLKIPAGNIEDGTEQWVKFTDGATPVPSEDTWIWVTDSSNVPSRLWVDQAGTKSAAAITVRAWIDTGTFVKIKKDGKNYQVTELFTPAVAHSTNSKALVTKGVITDIHDITEMGIYSGVDVANAPVTGHVIIEAFEDAQGDLDLTLKDQTSRRYEGGMPKGGTASWHHVAADHLFGTADPANTLGNDGDLYFKI